ncbi:MAG: site-specific DNA-methyltransferase [Clostridia bacterium]|nr:site-specific DNA-methyltransferase [Clostridia bacterium]
MQGKIVTVKRETSGSLQPENVLRQCSAAGAGLEAYAGSVQTIYLDPPFFTGRSFRRRLHTDETDVSVEAYADTYENMDAYVAFMRQALGNAKTLLTARGTLFLHVDYRVSARMRLLLDEVFGENRFINEIIWGYESGGRAKNFFSRKHDTIFFYARGKDYFFDLTAVPSGTREIKNNHMRRSVDENGRSYRMIKSAGREYRYYDDEPVYPTDVWTDISHLQQRDPERTGYETQKPLKLLQRILGSASKKGDLVADLFAGSGTTGIAAVRMGRRFLMCDQGDQAILAADARLAHEDCSYAIEAGTRADAALLEVDVVPVSGGRRIRLVGFHLPDENKGTGLHGLSAIDHWSCGYVVGDTYRRTLTAFTADQQVTVSDMTEGEGTLAVMIWDYLGNRRCYCLQAV